MPQEILDWIIDWILGNITDIDAYVQKLREQYPRLSDDELARLIVSRKSLKSGLLGFLCGLPGPIALPVSVPADVLNSWRVQIAMTVAIARVYGHTEQTTDLKTDIYLVLAGDAAKETLKRFGIAASVQVGRRVVDEYVTRDVMKQIWKVLGPKIISKAGGKSLVTITEMVPVVGGLVGFTFDWVATKAVGGFALKYYGGASGGPNPTLLETWYGGRQFSYTGSISSGVALLCGEEDQRCLDITREQCRSLLRNFAERTVPIGMSLMGRDEGLGEWLRIETGEYVVQYVAPILVAEGYAERISRSEIRFLRRRTRSRTRRHAA